MTHSTHDRIVLGDCLDTMRRLPDACVDAIVTDPPYGLSFMGRDWDHGVPGPAFWTEALRVAKPGAHLVAFGGTRTFHRLACAIEDAGWEIRDCLSWLYGSGFPKSKNLDGAWQGWGTALKPAWEPIILARKPLIGTVAANVTAYGTGAINVDACRIASLVLDAERRTSRTGGAEGRSFLHGLKATEGERHNAKGRWPANVALDEEAAAMLDEQTGERKSGIAVQRNGGGGSIFGGKRHATMRNDDWGYGDSGGASRFFYTAKASRKERGEGNNHPTVKSLSLMRWLVRLVTPKGGNVLDPFAGSGTTLLAAHLEGFDYLGIEREAEYVEIIRKRLARVEDLR